MVQRPSPRTGPCIFSQSDPSSRGVQGHIQGPDLLLELLPLLDEQVFIALEEEAVV